MNEMFWVIMIVTYVDTMTKNSENISLYQNVFFHLFSKFVQRFVCNECNIMGLSIVIFGKLQQKYVYNYCLTNILINNEVKLHNPKCIMHCFKNVRENSRFCNS